MRRELGLDRPRDGRPLWQRRLSTGSVFCRALVSNGYLSEQQMQRAAQRYRLGRSRDGGVIFWQIDEHGVLHDGKIMYYRPDCHRDHDRKPTWTSYLMRKAGQLPDDWRPEHCLFGLHLLTQSHFKGHTDLTDLTDNSSTPISGDSKKSVESVKSVCDKKTVCVVESEKTAVMMSELRPDCLWLATGGKTELNVARLKPLQGRRVILFPDTDTDGSAYREWYDVALAAGDVYGQPFTVSAILEQHATPSQKERKIDIADYFFEK